eukprot:GHVU01036189.1.p1 GENE.GHVU01036189.1~~GHVU01036189.1.p1  ORF type:complete len:121 (+),score=3.31 GHVU01036189.1:375-737(+)
MVVEIPSYADTLPSSAAASSRVIFDSAEHECGASHHIPRVLMAVRARRDTHTHTHTRAHTHTHTHTHTTRTHTHFLKGRCCCFHRMHVCLYGHLLYIYPLFTSRYKYVGNSLNVVTLIGN